MQKVNAKRSVADLTKKLIALLARRADMRIASSNKETSRTQEVFYVRISRVLSFANNFLSYLANDAAIRDNRIQHGEDDAGD